MTDSTRSYAHYEALTHRLILAQLTGDEHGYDTAADEVGDCPHCWRIVAGRLAERAATHIEGTYGRDMALSEIEACIATALDWQTGEGG
jgi:hypothetical protein